MKLRWVRVPELYGRRKPPPGSYGEALVAVETEERVAIIVVAPSGDMRWLAEPDSIMGWLWTKWDAMHRLPAGLTVEEAMKTVEALVRLGVK